MYDERDPGPTETQVMDWNIHNDHADGETPDFDIPDDPRFHEPLTLPGHNRPDGTWCPWSDCSTRSGHCPDGCPGGSHPGAKPATLDCLHGTEPGADCQACEEDAHYNRVLRGLWRDLAGRLSEALSHIERASETVSTLAGPDVFDLEFAGGHDESDALDELGTAARALRHIERIVKARMALMGD